MRTSAILICTLIVGPVAIATLTACSPCMPSSASTESPPSTSSSIPPDAPKVPGLEPPESPCQVAAVPWQGIIPGRSTKTEVIDTLGEPVQKEQSASGIEIYVYPPIVTNDISHYGNSIAFRHDDVVDWVDVWVLDSDGKFHTVAEFAQLYGISLDRVYVNERGDLGGPDQVYVWSQCGIAITAVHRGQEEAQVKDQALPSAEATEVDDYQLNFKYPVHPRASIQPRPDVRQIIVRKFLFEPTSFSSFEQFYADNIPYLLAWYYYEWSFAEESQ